MERPNVFDYHDPLQFLRDWFEYRKRTDHGFSLRALSMRAGFSSNGYLSKVLNGARGFTSKTLAKLAPFLKLQEAELNYLELLRNVSQPKSKEDKLNALQRLKNYSTFHNWNTKETEVYQYLTKWYYVAIREMANLPDFSSDPFWIKKRLKNRVTIEEIKDAIEFLQENGYLKVDEGQVSIPNKHLKCNGGVYRIALGEFYREMFDLAVKSFDNTPRESRKIKGYTVTATHKTFNRIRKLLEETCEKIDEISREDVKEDGNVQEVYQITMCAFPLTNPIDEKDEKGDNKDATATVKPLTTDVGESVTLDTKRVENE